MANFFTEFPEIPRKEFTELKKSIDGAYKDFSREWGNSIDAFFDPLLQMLIFF